MNRSRRSLLARILTVALAALVATAAAEARTPDAAAPLTDPAARVVEPRVHYFGASGCDFCENGKDFLQRWAREDPGLLVSTYDIVANSDHALLFVRLTHAMGIDDTVVPMTIIGHHVLLGFQDDETTGQMIREIVGQCRQVACPDVVTPFISPAEREVMSGTSWTVQRMSATSPGGLLRRGSR